MNTPEKIKVLTEINNLIQYSCTASENDPSNFDGLHRAIIKKYFQAESVCIDRSSKKISLEIPVDTLGSKSTLIDIEIDFKNFDTFLKSCIEDNHGSLLFYKNVLHYYHTLDVAN